MTRSPDSVYLHHDDSSPCFTPDEGWFHVDKGVNGEGLGKYVREPKPSTDFAEVYSNPCKDYLLFDKIQRQWFVGWYSDYTLKFYWTTHKLYGDECLDPSHWLPLPPDP